MRRGQEYVANPRIVLEDRVQARANVLMRAYINGRLQGGLGWPEQPEYDSVFAQAIRRALYEDSLGKLPT